MKFEVVCFGSAVIDVFVDTNLSEKNKFMCYPVGSKILLKNLKFDIGGGGTNSAVAFSRLGLKTGYLGKIGKDLQGKAILEMLKKEKVSFLGKKDKNHLTGYSIILDSKEHERTILTYKGANDELALYELDKINTSWLYYSSLLGKSFDAQEKLARRLCRKGTKLAFNPSEYLIKKENIKPLLKITEILVLNKEEASLLTKNKDLLKGLYSLGPKKIAITDKDKIIKAYDGKKKYSLIPHKIKVVERTGAGDAFASGFVAGQIRGKSIHKSLELGLRESESVIKYFGAKNNLLRMNL